MGGQYYRSESLKVHGYVIRAILMGIRRNFYCGFNFMSGV